MDAFSVGDMAITNFDASMSGKPPSRKLPDVPPVPVPESFDEDEHAIAIGQIAKRTRLAAEIRENMIEKVTWPLRGCQL